MADLGEWTLRVVVPQGGGECMEYEVYADPQDTGERLKQRIEKICGIPPDDMELFARNSESTECKQKWLNEEESLQQQEVIDGAQISVGVHGMQGNTDPLEDPETGETCNDHVQTSINSKGDTSYYFAHARKSELSEEQRIVSGGSPQKIAGGEDQVLSISEPANPSSAMFDDYEDTGRPRKPIKNYAWGDEKEVIKIYISKDAEPEAVQAAEDGKNGKVEVKWLPKGLRLVVRGKQLDHVLLLERVYYEIVPEECRFRVSPDKRITLTLKKKEAFTWLKLLKPD